jgi:hypothetical protein
MRKPAWRKLKTYEHCEVEVEDKCKAFRKASEFGPGETARYGSGPWMVLLTPIVSACVEQRQGYTPFLCLTDGGVNYFDNTASLGVPVFRLKKVRIARKNETVTKQDVPSVHESKVQVFHDEAPAEVPF